MAGQHQSPPCPVIQREAPTQYLGAPLPEIPATRERRQHFKHERHSRTPTVNLGHSSADTPPRHKARWHSKRAASTGAAVVAVDRALRRDQIETAGFDGADAGTELQPTNACQAVNQLLAAITTGQLI